PTLVDWLEEEKAALAVRWRLEGRAAEWVRLGQSSGGLLDEVELHEAERWLKSPEAQYLGYDLALPTLVEASKTNIERRTRRLTGLRIALLVVSVAAAVLGVGLAIYAFQQRQEALNNELLARQSANIAATAVFQAKQDAQLSRTAEAQASNQRNLAQTAEAESQSLARAGEALFELDHKPERALLLALASIPNNVINYQPFVARAFYRSFQDALIRRSLTGHTAAVRAIAWSPDNRELLTGSDDGTARIWDITTGKTLS